MNRIQFRRDTAARWTHFNPVLAPGEIGFFSDGDGYKMGDGVNSWSNLPVRGVPAQTAFNYMPLPTSSIPYQQPRNVNGGMYNDVIIDEYPPLKTCELKYSKIGESSSTLEVSYHNLEDVINFIQVFEGGLNNCREMVARMKEVWENMTVYFHNGNNDPNDYNLMLGEIGELMTEFYRTLDELVYDDNPILEGMWDKYVRLDYNGINLYEMDNCTPYSIIILPTNKTILDDTWNYVYNEFNDAVVTRIQDGSNTPADKEQVCKDWNWLPMGLLEYAISNLYCLGGIISSIENLLNTISMLVDAHEDTDTEYDMLYQRRFSLFYGKLDITRRQNELMYSISNDMLTEEDKKSMYYEIKILRELSLTLTDWYYRFYQLELFSSVM